MEDFMKKLVVVAALAFALTGAAANVAYAGPCSDSNCAPADSSKSGEATNPKASDKETCSQPSCRNDDRNDHHQAAKAAAKEAAQAATRAIFEAVKARNSSRQSRDDDKRSD
jgi:hypothetical protein